MKAKQVVYVEFKRRCQNTCQQDYCNLEKVAVSTNPAEVKIPEGYIAFRFKTYKIMELRKQVVKSEPFDISGWYYEGDKFELEDVKDKVSSEQYKKLYMSGCRAVVLTKNGNVFPLWAVDKVI